YHPLQAIHAAMPVDHMALDFIGLLARSGNNNEYVLLVIDICTRFVFLRALPDRTGKTTAQTLFLLFCDIGFPYIIQSDNGPEFRNELMSKLTELTRIEHRFTTPYQPRGNGVAERYVQTATHTLQKLLEGESSSWDR